MRSFGWILLAIVGLYVIGRGVVELAVVDFGDPASYRDDWGGPSLAGVLAVHCGPGLVALAGFVTVIARRLRARRRAAAP